jgi:predicted phosphoadenosine phosphosulfate sulfurtransferase
MSRSIHTIARHFLNKDSWINVVLKKSVNLPKKHPYTSALQFLLLEKLRTVDQQAYQAQVQKSILYYHDPVGFQYILDPSRFITELPDEKNNGIEEEQPEEISATSSAQAIPAEQENIIISDEPLRKEEETIVMTRSEPVDEPARVYRSC